MTLRIVQWATGNQGVEAIQAVIDRPDMALAGGWVSSDAKDGADLGTIAGRDPIGVAATRDVDALLALGVDCVAYMPRIASLDEVCRILASGASVVTTAFLFHPPSLPTADQERLRVACAEGGSTIHGNGLNPGVLSGVLPLAMSGMAVASSASPSRSGPTGPSTRARTSPSTTCASADPPTRCPRTPATSSASTAASSGR